MPSAFQKNDAGPSHSAGQNNAQKPSEHRGDHFELRGENIAEPGIDHGPNQSAGDGGCGKTAPLKPAGAAQIAHIGASGAQERVADKNGQRSALLQE